MSGREELPERRAHPRVPVELPVRIRSEEGEAEGTTIDLSEGGVGLQADPALIASRRLKIEIQLAELGWRELESELVRTGPDGRLAARFAAVATAGDREAVRSFLRRYERLEG